MMKDSPALAVYNEFLNMYIASVVGYHSPELEGEDEERKGWRGGERG